jgi:hypothetical protein
MESSSVSLREFLEVQIAQERELRRVDIQHVRELRELLFSEINRRLAEMNEMRAQILSERGSFVQREFYQQKHEELAARIARNDAQLGAIAASRSTLNWLWGAALGAVGLLLSGGLLVARIFGR